MKGDDERPFSRLPKIPANPAAAVAARAAVAVFALGFVDAGYSGDWSRIGAVSKEVEDWLKVAAFLVVPLCVLLAVSISGSTEEEP
ncbi:unnamed protein product [Linum tenue]|uniref:DUF7887 domain-containing protein n=1 Tax=Linum tenue TaxID=586396 RepID=A0AAV0I9V7_9ROSI|nr:unnamed protein product [Linum tenue]